LKLVLLNGRHSDSPFAAEAVAAVFNTFNVQRHLTSASTHRIFRAAAMSTWREAVTAA
jgi:hypothetical protein